MDGFIDNIIIITIDNLCWLERAKNAALLVIPTIFRPLHPYEQLKQDYPLSLHNLAREVHLSKRKTCLGWDIHTRSLRLFLTRKKETACIREIRSYLALTKLNTDKLEYLIGKLNHASHIITPARYHLNKLHQLRKRINNWGPQRLQPQDRQDPHLWINILQWVTQKQYR